MAIAAAFAAPSASAAPAPAWTLQASAVPTNFTPGDESGDQFYELSLINGGGEATDGSPLTVTATLPAGIEVKSVELLLPDPPSTPADYGQTFCEIDASGPRSIAECTVPSQLPNVAPALLGPGEGVRMKVRVAVPAGTVGALTGNIAVQGGGAPAEALTFFNEASFDVAHSGFQQFTAALRGDDGLPVTQASSHPYQFTTSFAINSKATPPGAEAEFVPAGGDVKDLEVDLPPGLIGNPTATLRCTAQQFNTLTESIGGQNALNACPDGSVVGFVTLRQLEGTGTIAPVPLYNLVPTRGMPAQFGFQVSSAPLYIDTKVRTGTDYGITATVRNASQVRRVTAALVTIWGTPADQAHDPLRGSCLLGREGLPFSVGSCPAGVPPKPFLRLPTSCQNPLDFAMRFDTWTNPGWFVSARDSSDTPTGCGQLAFDPSIRIVPTSSVADSPSGLRVNLHIPQEESSGALASADLRNAVVRLPSGVSVNPASANGLTGCASHQIDINGAGPARCPEASKIGAVEISTPLLDRPISGGVYVAAQTDNPFRSLIALYITAHDPQLGVVVKLAGRVDPDPVTGRLTTTFVDNPQLPFEDLKVEFFDGPRAPLRTPMTCGSYASTTSLKPWSAPHSGPDATPSDSFAISSGPAGGCPSGAVAPRLSAGVAEPVAGSHSPFVLRLTRADGTGEFSSVNAITPRGLTATLKGVATCSDAVIGQAASRTRPGEGSREVAAPSCPSSSAVGSITVGAGAGPLPFYTGGTVYLAGPYKGAPISLAAVVPAIAGPFDLGVVVSRIALQIDAATAQVTAQSDPLPTILFGIPLDVRDIRLNLNRAGFTLAPTNCEPSAVNALVTGGGGAASASDRFQVGGCRNLGFKPKLSLRLHGPTKRASYPRLTAVVTTRQGDANIAHASVALPHSQFLAQEHIRTVCTRVQFAAHRCPRGAVYGHATAITPLLDEPLTGPVYLRSSSNPLPDLVVALRGPNAQPIEVELAGRVDSKGGGIRNTFDLVPDAPVSKFTLKLKGGKKSLIVNSRNLCSGIQRATARFKGQNGKARNFRPVLKNDCGKKKARKAR